MAYERERYIRRKRIEEILVAIGLAVAVLLVATYSFAFDAPSVNEVSTIEVGIEAEGPPAVAVANVSANESENESGIPKWWYWSEEDWQKFREYTNQTEVIWVYNETTGEKIGGIVRVAGEPLWKELGSTEFSREKSPVLYLKGNRTGNCVSVPPICCLLLEAKGEENVRYTVARNINYNPDPKYIGCQHGWVEWTDSEGNEWVTDYNDVLPKEYWYQKYNWTVDWAQFGPNEMVFYQ